MRVTIIYMQAPRISVTVFERILINLRRPGQCTMAQSFMALLGRDQVAAELVGVSSAGLVGDLWSLKLQAGIIAATSPSETKGCLNDPIVVAPCAGHEQHQCHDSSGPLRRGIQQLICGFWPGCAK